QGAVLLAMPFGLGAGAVGVDFHRAAFARAAEFRAANLTLLASFKQSLLCGDAAFFSVKRSHRSSSLGAAILGDVDFRAADRGGADFAACRFCGLCDFWGVSVRGSAKFDHAVFEGPFHLAGAAVDGDITFSQAVFLNSADFGGARFAK